MDGKLLRAVCAQRLGIRVGAKTGEYLLKHVTAPVPPEQVPVMGGDARTGIPVRRDVPLAVLMKAISEAGAVSASSNAP